MLHIFISPDPHYWLYHVINILTNMFNGSKKLRNIEQLLSETLQEVLVLIIRIVYDSIVQAIPNDKSEIKN